MIFNSCIKIYQFLTSHWLVHICVCIYIYIYMCVSVCVCVYSLVSLFNGISTVVGYSMPKLFLLRTVMVLFNP